MTAARHRLDTSHHTHTHTQTHGRARPRRHTAGAAGIVCIAAALLAAMPAERASADDTGRAALPEIVVQGATLGLTPTEAAKIGSSVTVLTGEQLETRQIRHAADALRSVPGVAVSRSGAFGAFTQVRLRGAEGNHVLVLIDGVEINDTTSGEFDFASLLAEDIERIEVMRGPQSGIWGSNALAGVINIVTRSGKGPAQVVVRAEGGSFSTADASLSVSGGTDRVHGALSLTTRDTSGFNVSHFGNEDDGAALTAVHAKGGFSLTRHLSVEGFARHSETKADTDRFAAPPGAVPGDLAVSTDLPGAISDTMLRTYHGAAKLDLLDGRWQSRAFASRHETDRTSKNPIFGRSINRGARDKHGAVSTLTLPAPGLLDSSHAFTGLVERETEVFTPSADLVERSRELESYAGEYRGEFKGKLFVSAAVRHDKSDAFEDFTTYKLSAAKIVAPLGVRLHASYGTGVVFPSLFEQFGVVPGIFTPNPDLLPEESEGWDAGVEKSMFGDRLIVDVTYFEQNLENEIFSPFFGPPVNLVGESTRQGIEVTASVRPHEKIEIVGAYTYLEAEEPDGREEVRRPTHSGSVNAAYRFAGDRGSVNLGVIYNGDMEDVVFDAFTFAQGRRTLDSYVVVNLAMHYDVRPNVRIFGRVENLFDEDYEEVFGYNTPDVAAYGGVRIRLGGEERDYGDGG